MAYKQIDTTSTVTFIPNDIDGSVSVLVFYPGIPITIGIGRKYMPGLIKAGVPDWFDKYVIVIPEKHTTPWSDVLKDYRSEMEARGLKESNLSIGIFSGSGNNGSPITSSLGNLVVENLMLMDPVFSGNIKSSSKKLIESGSKGYSMYNPKNWKSSPGIAAGQAVIPTIIGAANSVDTRETDYDHEKIPTKFLLRFRDQIEPTLISILKPNVDDGSGEPTTESTGGSKITEIIPDGVYTFNVVKEGVFIPVSTGTSSTASKFGELTLIEEEEGGFVFQDDFDQGELGEEFTESEFTGFEESDQFEEQEYGSESEKLDTENQSDIINSEPYVQGKHKLDLLPGIYKGNPVKGKPVELRLCQIHGKPVNVNIAEDLLDMIEAAKSDGISLKVTSGFRPAYYPNLSAKSDSGVKVSSQSQEDLYKQNCKGGKCSPATAPAGRSKHGTGIAIDFNTGSKGPKFTPLRSSGSIYKWLIRNSWKFGFVRTVSSEEWHFEYWAESKKKGPYTRLKRDHKGTPDKTRYYSDLGIDNLQIA
jgi:hypothetical protein